MKLHAIQIRHSSQKDSKEAIVCYVLADSQDEILRRLDSKDEFTYGLWADKSSEVPDEEDGDEDEPAQQNEDGHPLLPIYDDDGEEIGRETYLQRMLRLRGEFNDPDAEYEDAYYGVTHYGWDEGREVTEADVEILLRLDIAKDWRVGK